VVKDYAQSFKDVLVYEKSNPKDPNVLKDFTKTIDKIRDRHTNTVITMAEAVMAMKHSATSVQKSGKNGNGNKQPRYMQNIQYFLDRLYTSRISSRMLINQHTALFDLEIVRKIPSTLNFKLICIFSNLNKNINIFLGKFSEISGW